MMSLRGLVRIQPQLRFSLIKPVQNGPSLLTLSAQQRHLTTSPTLNRTGQKQDEIHRKKIQNVLSAEERHEDVVSLDALKAVEPGVGKDFNNGPNGVNNHQQGCTLHPRTVFKHEAGQAGCRGGFFIGHSETSLVRPSAVHI